MKVHDAWDELSDWLLEEYRKADSYDKHVLLTVVSKMVELEEKHE